MTVKVSLKKSITAPGDRDAAGNSVLEQQEAAEYGPDLLGGCFFFQDTHSVTIEQLSAAVC